MAVGLRYFAAGLALLLPACTAPGSSSSPTVLGGRPAPGYVAVPELPTPFQETAPPLTGAVAAPVPGLCPCRLPGA
jgi:hypothetical protein